MKLEEMIGLLAMINQYDTRVEASEQIAEAWMAAIEDDMPLSYASQQVIKYYGSDNKFLLTVGWLNQQWRTERRNHTFFKGLPKASGTVADQERARWFMMLGITEGVQELNTGISKDPWVSHVLRLRMKHGTNLKQLHHKALFPQLDWDWFEQQRDRYSQRLG